MSFRMSNMYKKLGRSTIRPVYPGNNVSLDILKPTSISNVLVVFTSYDECDRGDIYCKNRSMSVFLTIAMSL